MDQNFNYIKESEFAKRKHILKSFDESEINSAISREEFDERFSKGHEIFTTDGINKFVEAATKGQETVSDEIVKGIEASMTGLKRTVVNNGEGFSVFYVREIVEKQETEFVPTDETVVEDLPTA